MIARALLIAGLIVPAGMDTYHAACLAFDPPSLTIYISDPFEIECTGGVAACKSDVVARWTAFLRKERLAQSSDATQRCEMYKDGSTPDESPMSRVRKWRDEEAAQAQRGPVKYNRVTQTLFGIE